MPEGSKLNYWGYEFGNGDGQLSFGKISFDNAVTTDVMLKGSNGSHWMEFGKDGKRKGWTTFCAPGAFQIDCGDNLTKEQTGFYLNANNGDIRITAENGKIILTANDIQLISKGVDGTEGNISLDAQGGNIKLKGNNVTVDGTQSVKIISTGLVALEGKTGMQIIAPIVQGVTCATKKTPKIGKVK